MEQSLAICIPFVFHSSHSSHHLYLSGSRGGADWSGLERIGADYRRGLKAKGAAHIEPLPLCLSSTRANRSCGKIG
jgi:hypothetical protein